MVSDQLVLVDQLFTFRDYEHELVPASSSGYLLHMSRRIFLALLAVACLPAAVHAEPLLMKAQLALTPLPRVLFFGVRAWVLLAFVLVLVRLWRVVRGPAKETHLSRREALWRVLRLVVWAAVPMVAVEFLLNRTALANKLPGLPVAALWTALFLPGLLVPPGHAKARWLRLGALVAGDLGGASLVLWRTISQGLTPNAWALACFLLLLHAAVIVSFVARGRRFPVTRWAALLLLLFLCSSLFMPPAIAADRQALRRGAVRSVPNQKGPVRSAVFDADGRTALVVFANDPKRIFRIELASGRPQIAYAALDSAFTRLERDPRFKIMVAVTDRGFNRRAYLFDLVPFEPRGTYDSDEPFTVPTLSTSEDHLAFGSAGTDANLRLCPVRKGTGATRWPLPETCRNLRLPLACVGDVLVQRERGLVFAAEGSDGFLDGWRLVEVATTNGYIMRSAIIGRSLGGMVYDPKIYSIYLARPAQGQIDTLVAENLTYQYSIPAEPGVKYLALDEGRRVLLAASPQTGRLLVYDLHRRYAVAHVPIGTGITQLDYHPATATALVAAARGLVTVEISRLPGLEAR